MVQKSRVNWLVIGIGDVTSKRVIPGILAEPRSELYGVVTRDLSKAAAYPGAKAWTSLDEALRDPEINAVYVASPVALHAGHAILSLRAGRAVLLEKPVAMSYPEAVTIAETAAKTGSLLGVAYFRRLFPKLIRAKHLIAEGAIGTPVLAEACFHGWLESEDRAWLRDPALAGGGPLYDTASHRIDALNFVFGPPQWATGLRTNPVHRLGVDEAASVSILYRDGVQAQIDVRWNSGIRRDELRFTGTKGELVLDDFNGPLLRLTNADGTREENLPSHPNVHYPLIEDFVAAVLDGTAPVAPPEEAILTDWVTEQVMVASPALR